MLIKYQPPGPENILKSYKEFFLLTSDAYLLKNCYNLKRRV